MTCTTHRWMKKSLPCPYLQCPNGARGLWIVVGKSKKVVYVRQRIKDEMGLRYDWERTSYNPSELLAESEEEEICF